MPTVVSAFAGALFALGLVVSGMTNPGKVIAFLDVSRAWDPSLAFVMAGAIAVYAPLYRFIVRRTVPWYAQEFVVMSDSRIDARLLVGAALFGVGWGIAGYCPGPSLTALGSVAHSGAVQPVVFVASMIAGMLGFRVVEEWRGRLASDRRMATPS